MRQFIKSLLDKRPEAPTQEPEKQKFLATYDPLDLTAKERGWVGEKENPIKRNISNFPMYEIAKEAHAMDSVDAPIRAAIMDSCDPNAATGSLALAQAMPELLQNWYMSQSFIGHQACALIAQHWLVDKACSMVGEDASRNGWEIKVMGEEVELSKFDRDRLRSYDVSFKLKANLVELERFKNIFGIRVAIFKVESDDEKYYEKPFNIDGVTEGSYKGISQVDPYWMTPMMTAESTADPSSIHFYDPQYWVINGKKYHHSHLIVARGPVPADVLKPTYIFGGIPMPQRIYERVYAAERTANEAPLLALNKRTTALHVDVEKAIAQQSKFEERLAIWLKYRDNHAVKILGKDEVMEQFDTSLSDFDAVIMNQYQLVAAIAEVPATKLLGTSPKGFNATGDFEMKSYHEKLKSTQEHVMSPMVERHYLILCRSLGINVDVQVVFEPVDSVTTKERAELNDKKADTDQKNINMGAISPEEVRNRLKDDKHSGYNRLTGEEAEDTPGASPDNLAALEQAGAKEEQGAAAQTSAQAKTKEAGVQTKQIPAKQDGVEVGATEATVPDSASTPPMAPATPNSAMIQTIELLLSRMEALESAILPEGIEVSGNTSQSRLNKVHPAVDPTVNPSVVGLGSVVASMEGHKQPKMKMGGLMLSIENPRNTIRKGMDIDGTAWESKMPHHYGFIKGTMGADGDEVDCFVGNNLKSDQVFVINQKTPSSGEFDEHKVMLGFDSEEEAVQAYHAAYATDWEGFDNVIQMTMDTLRDWLQSDCSIPAGQKKIQN